MEPRETATAPLPPDSDLDAIFLGDEAEEQPLPRKKVPVGDVYEAARAGDVDRLRFWLEDQGVDVNARDCWDSVALYYACLAGHLDAALLLLDNGAICSEHTYDGDRCYYAALNLQVRKLLKAFESRPPPLQPLPAALRQALLSAGVNSACCDARDVLGPAAAPCLASDMVFHVSGKPIAVHRALLAARSPFFCHKFANEWRDRNEIRFARRKLSFSALFSLLHFFYADRLDVAVEDMEDLIRICRVCECRALQAHLEKELVHQKYADYKSLHGVDHSQRRYILQGSALPHQHRLPAAMRNLFLLTLANSDTQQPRAHQRRGQDCQQISVSTAMAAHDTDNGCNPCLQLQERQQVTTSSLNTPLPHALLGEDHADVCFLVEGRMFRGHKFILAARSEYFRARFCRATEDENGSGTTQELPVLEEHDISSSAFQSLLEFVYTGTVENVDPSQAEEIFDAASRYLVFSLKRAVADALLPQLDVTSPAELCSWLLMADMYGVWKLRDHCLDVIALNLKLFASTPEFRAMVASLPPPSGESCLRTSVPAAPGEAGKGVRENILDDLREKWLALEGEELDKRDDSAVKFDTMLEQLVLDFGNVNR